MAENVEGIMPRPSDELTQVLQREYAVTAEQLVHFGPWIIFNHGRQEPATFACRVISESDEDINGLYPGVLLRRMKEALSSEELGKLRKEIELPKEQAPARPATHGVLSTGRREHDLIVHTDSLPLPDLFRAVFPIMTSPERKPFFQGRELVQIEMNLPPQT